MYLNTDIESHFRSALNYASYTSFAVNNSLLTAFCPAAISRYRWDRQINPDIPIEYSDETEPEETRRPHMPQNVANSHVSKKPRTNQPMDNQSPISND